MMMPRPFMYTSVLAVPRSMPMSLVNIARILLKIRLKKSCTRFMHSSLTWGLRAAIQPKRRSNCAVRCTGSPMML